MNSLFRPCLFFLSFLPLWISIAFIDVLSIIGGGAYLCTERISLGGIAFGSLFSSFIVFFQMKRNRMRSSKNYVLCQATSQRAITADYLLSYILPLFAFDFTLWYQVVLFLLFYTVLAFLCIRHNYIYANIVLEFWKYNCYDCTLLDENNHSVTMVILSKQNLTAMPNHSFDLISLGDGYRLDLN